MAQRAATPSLAPGRDDTFYLVLNSQAGLKTLVAVAFDTAEGWIRDVTAEIAHEVSPLR
jgi:hypothetical protein